MCSVGGITHPGGGNELAGWADHGSGSGIGGWELELGWVAGNECEITGPVRIDAHLPLV